MKSEVFKEALIKNNLELLKTVPKADVHNHSGLGMRFSTFNTWAGGKVTAPPDRMDGIKGLENYISNETMKYVNDRGGFEFLTEAAIQSAIEDGVTVLETSIDCCNIMYYQSPQEFFDYLRKVNLKYTKEIHFKADLGVHRGLPSKYWESCFVPCVDSGVFKSIDLYGNEEIQNHSLYKEYFKYAEENKLKIKIHTGEFSTPEDVIKDIEALNPNELQHGINSVHSSKAVGLIKERGIRLNICPTSNVYLGAVKSIESHPLKKLYNEGVKITINTDDLLIFDRSVSEEFLYVYNSGLLNEEELDQIRLNGLT